MMQLRAFVLTQKGCTVHQQEKKKPPNRYVTGSPSTAVRVVDESPGVPGAERMAKSGGKRINVAPNREPLFLSSS